MLISLLLFAAAGASTLSAVCQWLRDAPSDETARKALLATLPPLGELQRRLNAGLAADLPKTLFQQAWRMAIDLHEVPYYGQPQCDPLLSARRTDGLEIRPTDQPK